MEAHFLEAFITALSSRFCVRRDWYRLARGLEDLAPTPGLRIFMQHIGRYVPIGLPTPITENMRAKNTVDTAMKFEHYGTLAGFGANTQKCLATHSFHLAWYVNHYVRNSVTTDPPPVLTPKGSYEACERMVFIDFDDDEQRHPSGSSAINVVNHKKKFVKDLLGKDATCSDTGSYATLWTSHEHRDKILRIRTLMKNEEAYEQDYRNICEAYKLQIRLHRKHIAPKIYSLHRFEDQNSMHIGALMQKKQTLPFDVSNLAHDRRLLRMFIERLVEMFQNVEYPLCDRKIENLLC